MPKELFNESRSTGDATPGAKTFGDLLREYRVRAGLSQGILAERAQLSVGAIGALERGIRRAPYRSTISLLANALSLNDDDRAALERASIPAGHARGIVPASNLPSQFSSFVGRDRDVAKIDEMLASQRLVSLVGAGGVGKTRLALHAAAEFATNSKNGELDGVWFVDFSAVTDDSRVASTIAECVGAEQGRAVDQLITYLRSQRFLLVLDNCEHLVDAVAKVARSILNDCAQGKILATSREALALDGERIYRVPTLSVPRLGADRTLSVDEALNFAAIRLFCDRAEAADSRFELTEALVPVVTDICRRLEGIALAIELAAARTSAFPPADMAQRLTQHFLLLAGGNRTSLPRHKTMRALFDWSYELLDDTERELFRRLSIFQGGFALQLATQLCAPHSEESIMHVLASLVDKSLVQSDTHVEPARYRLLEPARQYASEKLREHGEHDAVSREHAQVMLALAERFDSALGMTPDSDWDAYVEPEQENFRAAFEWALGARGDTRLAQRLAGSRCATWFGTASGEVQHWVRRALETCDETTPPKVRARLELSSARVAQWFGDDNRAAIAAAQRALSYQPADDAQGVAAAQHLLGWALLQANRIGEAEEVLRDALATARSGGAQYEYVYATKALALARTATGDFAAAHELISEALTQFRAGGCHRLAAQASVTLAEIEFSSGRVEAALQLGEEAAKVFRSHGQWLFLADDLCSSSIFLLSAGRYEEARRDAREALQLARRVGYPRYIWKALQHLAGVATLNQDPVQDDIGLCRAAHILGFLDESLTQKDFPRGRSEKAEYEKLLITLRKKLGEEKLANLMAAGKEWSEDEAVAEAMLI